MSEHDLHPIVSAVFSLLKVDEHTHRQVLDNESAQKVSEILKRAFDSVELPNYVIELARVAYMMQDKFDSPKVAERLLQIAATATQPLLKLGASIERLKIEAKRKFAKASGIELSNVAPKVGDKAPAGSTAIGNLKIARRLR